jgi:putative colanic acid biosynthesis acetyltransferase WcaF
MSRDLSTFTLSGYDKGRSKLMQGLWLTVMSLVFRTWFCPARFRCSLLRWFGAEVGANVLIRHRVRILWPWKLTIGDNSWIGEGAWLLNLEPITIGSDVCISQEALLCTGSHDFKATDFRYRNAAITVHDGAWVAARALVLPGVTIGACSVVSAGTVLGDDLPELTLAHGHERRPLPEPS